MTSRDTRAKKRHATPATLALLIEGAAAAGLDAALRVCESAASHYLAGRRHLHGGFEKAVVGLVGKPGGSRVLALIPPTDAAQGGARTEAAEASTQPRKVNSSRFAVQQPPLPLRITSC